MTSSIINGRRPIMALLDLLGQKWALRVIWELRNGALNSRALRSASGEISPTVLQSRINELRAAGIVVSGDNGYSLTALGSSLRDVHPALSLCRQMGGSSRAEFGARRLVEHQRRDNTGACSAISATTQSMNTRSLALTWRFGGKARYIGIGFICQSSNKRTSSPLARCGLAM